MQLDQSTLLPRQQSTKTISENTASAMRVRVKFARKITYQSCKFLKVKTLNEQQLVKILRESRNKVKSS